MIGESNLTNLTPHPSSTTPNHPRLSGQSLKPIHYLSHLSRHPPLPIHNIYRHHTNTTYNSSHPHVAQLPSRVINLNSVPEPLTSVISHSLTSTPNASAASSCTSYNTYVPNRLFGICLVAKDRGTFPSSSSNPRREPSIRHSPRGIPFEGCLTTDFPLRLPSRYSCLPEQSCLSRITFEPCEISFSIALQSVYAEPDYRQSISPSHLVAIHDHICCWEKRSSISRFRDRYYGGSTAPVLIVIQAVEDG